MILYLGIAASLLVTIVGGVLYAMGIGGDASSYALLIGMSGLLVTLLLFLVGRTGGQAPPSPLLGPDALPAPVPERNGCPACGQGHARILSQKETQAFYGYDRFVLYLPRQCLACGHTYEIHPGNLGCYFLAGFSALAVLFGVFVIALGGYLAFALATQPAEIVADPRELLAALGCPFVGAAMVWRFSRETLRYLRQCR